MKDGLQIVHICKGNVETPTLADSVRDATVIVTEVTTELWPVLVFSNGVRVEVYSALVIHPNPDKEEGNGQV